MRMRSVILFSAAAVAALGVSIAHAAGSSISGHSPLAISMFLAIVLMTLAVTFWAARRVHSASDYYTAGGRISGMQNGLAICGDFMSASTFLGVIGLAFTGN